MNLLNMEILTILMVFLLFLKIHGTFTSLVLKINRIMYTQYIHRIAGMSRSSICIPNSICSLQNSVLLKLTHKLKTHPMIISVDCQLL